MRTSGQRMAQQGTDMSKETDKYAAYRAAHNGTAWPAENEEAWNSGLQRFFDRTFGPLFQKENDVSERISHQALKSAFLDALEEHQSRQDRKVELAEDAILKDGTLRPTQKREKIYKLRVTEDMDQAQKEAVFDQIKRDYPALATELAAQVNPGFADNPTLKAPQREASNADYFSWRLRALENDQAFRSTVDFSRPNGLEVRFWELMRQEAPEAVEAYERAPNAPARLTPSLAAFAAGAGVAFVANEPLL